MMSASPANSATAANSADQAQKSEQITFRFCRECSNMLYPREDRDQKKLMYACRTCQFSEEASSSCVFRNVLSSSVGETAGVTQDVGSDPTVGAPDLCLHCGTVICCSDCGSPMCNGHAVSMSASESEEYLRWVASDEDPDDSSMGS